MCVLFLPFQCHGTGFAKDPGGPGNSSVDCLQLVTYANEHACKSPNPDTGYQDTAASAGAARGNPSVVQKARSPGMFLIREHLQGKTIWKDTADMIEASWRPATRDQYSSHLQKWKLHCVAEQIDAL